jgi:hypothetical protein
MAVIRSRPAPNATCRRRDFYVTDGTQDNIPVNAQSAEKPKSEHPPLFSADRTSLKLIMFGSSPPPSSPQALSEALKQSLSDITTPNKSPVFFPPLPRKDCLPRPRRFEVRLELSISLDKRTNIPVIILECEQCQCPISHRKLRYRQG